MSDSGVAKALEEYEAAQAQITRTTLLSLRTNIFARRLSQIEEVDEPVEASDNSKKPLRIAENSSANKSAAPGVEPEYTGTSQPDYFRLGSIVLGNLNSDDDEPNAPLADFTRRVLVAAQALANKDQSDIEEYGTTEEIPRNEVVVASTKTTGTGKAQVEVYANLLGMMQRMVEEHEQTKKTTGELLLSHKLEAQRLATMIATQPPSAPPPVDSRQEVEAWNRIAYENQKYGALQAFATYSKPLCGDNTAAYSQIMHPIINAPQGDIMQLLAEK